MHFCQATRPITKFGTLTIKRAGNVKWYIFLKGPVPDIGGRMLNLTVVKLDACYLHMV